MDTNTSSIGLEMIFPSASALRVFDAAARTGSFKSAAEELSVTPTAVSHQIRRLEEQVGVALFVRKTRKVELTHAGERLAQSTQSAFRQISDALEEISSAEKILTVTTTPAFAALWLVPRLRDFEAANPGIQVHVDTSMAPVDLERDRRVDIAIRYGQRTYPNVKQETMLTEKFGVYGAPNLVDGLTRMDGISLIDTRWHLPSLAPITWTDWFKAAGLDTPTKVDYRSFEDEQHVISAGLAGQGLILISDILASDSVKRGWLKRFGNAATVPGFSYCSVVTKSSLDLSKVRRFLSWFRDACRTA